MKRPVRIMLAEDHDIVREGFRSLLHSREGLRVVGEARDGREAVAIATSIPLDIAIMDINLPLLNGIDATRQIHALRPSVRVIGLSAHVQESFVSGMLEAGAVAYLPKNCTTRQLFEAIAAAMEGRMYLSPEVTAGALRAGHSGPGDQVSRLSPREREILQLLAEGRSVKEIAGLLKIAISTVHTHRQHLMEKTSAHGVADLARLAVSTGLISVDRIEPGT